MATNNRGVFTLKTSAAQRSKGYWPTVLTTWFENQDQGDMYHYGAVFTPAPTNLVSHCYRYDFANDSAVSTFKSNLDIAGADGVSNQTGFSSRWAGYFAGGFRYSPSPAQGGAFSFIGRVDYYNDTGSVSSRANMSTARDCGNGASIANYGYMFGGGDYNAGSTSSRVDRFDYQNDTSASVEKGHLTASRTLLGGLGNKNYGYAAGGVDITPNPKVLNSIIDRIDYSNDTATALLKGPLSASRTSFHGAGNKDYGYFGGGSTAFPSTTPSMVTIVDRVDFANDTIAATPKGNLIESSGLYDEALPQAKPRIAGSNSQNAWFGASTSATNICRIDFNNDTVTATKTGATFAYSSGATAVCRTKDDLDGRYFLGTNSIGGGIPGVDDKNDILSTNDVAYVMGQQSSPAGPVDRNEIRRFSLANDTATDVYTGARLSQTPDAYWHRSAAGNTHYGLWAGGSGPGTWSKIDRIDYSNDTADGIVKANLTTAAWGSAGVGNNDYGWFIGGYYSSDKLTSIQRCNYANDFVQASHRANMSQVGTNNSRAGGNNDNAYWFGSVTGGDPVVNPISNITRLSYASDMAVPIIGASNASGARDSCAAISNGGSVYFGGGSSSAPAYTTYSTVDRFDLSNHLSTGIAKANLTIARKSCHSWGNPSYGYFVAGYSDDTGTNYSVIERLDYSNDTASPSVRSNLSQGNNHVGNSNSTLNNGLTGSYAPNNILLRDVTIPQFYYPPSQFGYFGGGYNPSAVQTTIDRIEFHNDTVTASARTTAAAKYYVASVGSKFVAYWSGGYNNLGSYSSSTRRIEYNDDTVAAVPKGSLSAAANKHATFGTVSYGYWSGGTDGNPLSTTNRLDFSTDTNTMVTKGPLANDKRYASGMGNASYGYAAGGADGGGVQSFISRLEFSSDTTTALPKGDLSSARHGIGGTGNEFYGYNGGGWYNVTTVDRIDYSNDTATAVAKGPLSTGRYAVGATGNKSYGYWAGGTNPGEYSIIDRLDYSSDTTACAPKGPLTLGRYGVGGVGGGENALPQ